MHRDIPDTPKKVTSKAAGAKVATGMRAIRLK
jgi:hypothetical protein